MRDVRPRAIAPPTRWALATARNRQSSMRDAMRSQEDLGSGICRGGNYFSYLLRHRMNAKYDIPIAMRRRSTSHLANTIARSCRLQITALRPAHLYRAKRLSAMCMTGADLAIACSTVSRARNCAATSASVGYRSRSTLHDDACWVWYIEQFLEIALLECAPHLARHRTKDQYDITGAMWRRSTGHGW